MQTLRILRDEHRTLAAVLHGFLHLVRDIRAGHAAPDFALLGAMLHYIDTFPERFHHPKEDRYLFRLLRTRDPAAAPLLDRLHEEHRAGGNKIRLLVEALERYERGVDDGFATFAEIVAEYAAFHWNHMRCEEMEVLPLAEHFLTRADWDEIDAAFTGHTDPILGEDAAHQYELVRRILDLAPRSSPGDPR